MTRYSGREFSDADIRTIREIIDNHPTLSRRKLSSMVCQALNWRNRAGGLKDMRCRVVLLDMERDRLVNLPKVLKKFTCSHAIINKTPATDPRPLITHPVNEFDSIELGIVDNRKMSKLWNEYIDRYHYLGYKKLPGNQLRYIAFSGLEIIALFGFSAAAWKTAPRDNAIGWISKQRENNLHLIVNNARFLILPWIQSKNLASKLLSLTAKQLPNDWETRYNYRPVLLETFVEIPRFTGTCYKAANWIHVGTTTGRGRNSRTTQATLPKKDVWLMPLRKQFKKILCSNSSDV